MNTTVASSNFNFETDRQTSSMQSNQASFFSKLKRITTISEVLRLFGACAVIASMSLFLLNGWSDGNDIQRYLKLLCQTGLLTVAGLTLSFILKENKGARLFFGLSLISVVANFMILGALTYSMFQLDSNLIQYPDMVSWKAIDTNTFWPVFAGAVVLLAVLTRFSFSIFARNIAGPLSLSFLLMSALLLIPVRSSLIISIIAIISFLIASALVKKLCQNENVILTHETKFALALIFAPSLLMIVRSLSLYNIDQVMLTTLSGLTYLALRFIISRFTESSFLQSAIEKFQFCVAVFLSIHIATLVPHVIDIANCAVFSICLLALTYDQVKTSKNIKWHKLIVPASSFIIVTTHIVLSFFSNDITFQIISLFVCATTLSFSSFMESSSIKYGASKIISLLGVLVCGFILAAQAIAYIQLGNWIVIGLIGVALIVGGSLFERYGMKLFSLSKETP